MKLRQILLSSLVLCSLLPAARAETPQHFAIELKFGPYIPAIDQSPGVVGSPFSDLYGPSDAPRGDAPPRSLLSQLEFDYQFFNRFGTLGVGVSAGFFRMTTKQLVYFGDKTALAACDIGGSPGETRTFGYPKNIDGKFIPKTDPSTGCFSGDEDNLNIVPLSLLLVYRFDYLDRRFRVPLIPYFKIGLGYYLWWMGSSSEFVTHQMVDSLGHPTADGPPASGGTFGFVLHPGISLDLGAIDRQAARIMDQEIGLNRVSAFVELNYARIDNFGSPAYHDVEVAPGRIESKPTTLNLSETSLSAGLSFEF